MQKRLGAVFVGLVLCVLCAGCINETDGDYTVPVLDSMDDVADYLTAAPGGNYNNPVQLAVSVDADDWGQLFDAIAEADKYVALDLSRCPNAPEEFDFGMMFNAGAYYNIASISLPEGITAIIDFIPTICPFAQVTLPQTLITIGACAFYSAGFTQITLPDALTTIGDAAFAECFLKHITLPEGITIVGHDAFAHCKMLELVICLAPYPPYLGERAFDAFPFDPPPPALSIKVPAASVEAYKTADGWSEYADIIGAL